VAAGQAPKKRAFPRQLGRSRHRSTATVDNSGERCWEVLARPHGCWVSSGVLRNGAARCKLFFVDIRAGNSGRRCARGYPRQLWTTLGSGAGKCSPGRMDTGCQANCCGIRQVDKTFFRTPERRRRGPVSCLARQAVEGRSGAGRATTACSIGRAIGTESAESGTIERSSCPALNAISRNRRVSAASTTRHRSASGCPGMRSDPGNENARHPPRGECRPSRVAMCPQRTARRRAIAPSAPRPASSSRPDAGSGTVGRNSPVTWNSETA